MQHLATATALKEIFSTIIDGGSYEQIDRHFTPDYIDHSAVGDQHGTEAFIALLEGFRLAIPGFRHDVSDVTLVGEDMALWQTHVTATFSGEFMGVRGHGQQIDLWVPNAAKFADDGRMSEHWGLAQDALGRLMSQMGVDAATAPTG